MLRFDRHQAPWILAFALIFTTKTHAQQAVNSGPDSLRLSAARRALEASGAIDVMLAGIRANLPAQRAAAPQLPAEFWTRFESRIVQDAPQLLDSITVLYARTFTYDELEAMTTFYRSPVGERLREVQPTLVAESSAIGQRWGFRIGADVFASLAPR